MNKNFFYYLSNNSITLNYFEKCYEQENPPVCKRCQDGKEVNDDNIPCDDGDPCTINDRCVNGVCIGDPVTSAENPNCGGGSK